MLGLRLTDSQHRGQHIASFLKGAWRPQPPQFERNAASFTAIIPHLVNTGAGALGWWKTRNHDPQAFASAKELEQIYRVHRCEAFLKEMRLQELIDRLSQSGEPPILSKGWAVARRYPELGLRPFGDFDLHVDPAQLHDTARALAAYPDDCQWVDLHAGVPELSDRSFAEISRRTCPIKVGDTIIRTLGAEDQLRQLCLHFARHGGWRPLWLCDIALFLETVDADFDWMYCLSGDNRLTAWVLAVLGLAVRVLEARCPTRHIAGIASSWLDHELLREWSRTDPGDSHTRDNQTMATYLSRPWQIWRGIRRRVPNAIEARFKTYSMPDARTGRFWQRLTYCWSRALRFTKRPLLPASHNLGPVQVHVAE